MPYQHNVPCRFKPLGLLLGFSLAAGTLQGAHAQDANPAPGSTVEAVKTESFKVVPSISLTETWDDNIFASNNIVVDDTITTLDASVKANSNWALHRLNLDAGVSADYYADYDTQDVVDWWAGADGRFDLSPRSHALGGVRFTQDHEDRSATEFPVISTDPTTYTTSRAHLGFAHQLDAFTIRLGGVYELLDFDQGSTPTFDVDQRDRKQYSVGARFSYQLNPRNEMFFQASTDTREYDENTVGRDSDGYRLGLGLRYKQGADLEAEGFLGQMSQDYDTVTYSDVSDLYYGASLKWKASAQTRVTAAIDRSISETTLTGASSYLDTVVIGRVEYDATSRVTLNGRLSYANSDYQGVTLDLDEYEVGVGARYYFDNNIYLSGGYNYITRNANAPIYEYDRNLFFLTLGYTPRNR